MNAMTNLNLANSDRAQIAMDDKDQGHSEATAAKPSLTPTALIDKSKIHKVRASLRYKKPHACLKSYQLPFIGKGDDLNWDFWSVPLIGGYNSSDAGVCLAKMLLLYFRQNELGFADDNLLSSIIIEMLHKARSASDEELNSLECQVYGFMKQISVCVIGVAQSDAMHALDKVDPKILLRETNAALNRKTYRDQYKGATNGPNAG